MRTVGYHPGGSSPLARGLRATTQITMQAVADHPRSRGVYRGIRRPVLTLSGSSPLARGLRGRFNIAVEPPGIIPARAGFTHPSRWPRPACWDHPRSRGVYAVVVGSGRPAEGSSPLARGLLASRRARLLARGIIPARAGFTRGFTWMSSTCWDHPRSRGVYVDKPSPGDIVSGSSPLARGLRAAGSRFGSPSRIIPARAGFTVEEPGHLQLDGGSSPLARGLHLVDCVEEHHRGIIPARAGFTATCRRSWIDSSDHPRSRGVYSP